MLSNIEIFFSILMTLVSIFTSLNFYFLWKQRRRDVEMHTTDHIAKIDSTILAFWKDLENIPQYDASSREVWNIYITKVEPYLSFLLWLSLKIEYKLFKVRILKKFIPLLKENYTHIKDYIIYTRTTDQDAWAEVDYLNKKLGIE